MKFFILFILSFFFLLPNASAFCTLKKQVQPNTISTFSSKKTVSITLKLTFKQRLVLKYLSLANEKKKKAINNLFIIGFLIVVLGLVANWGLITLACFFFGGLTLLTAVFLSIIN